MNDPEPPWIVEGVDIAIRNAAHRDAAAAGMTVGAWIERIILAEVWITPPASDEMSSPVIDNRMLDAIRAEFDASQNRIDSALRPVALTLQDLAQRLAARPIRESEPAPSEVAGPEAVSESERRAIPPPPTQSFNPDIDLSGLPVPVQPRPAKAPGDDDQATGSGTVEPLPPSAGLSVTLAESDFEAPTGAPKPAPVGAAPDRPAHDPRPPGRKSGRTLGRVSLILTAVAIVVYLFAEPLGLDSVRAIVDDAVAVRATTAWQTVSQASSEARQTASDWFWSTRAAGK